MPQFKLGIERLLTESDLQNKLRGRRLALLAHPASVTQDLTHSLDALMSHPILKVDAAFGPQHGMRGEKQDNMIESGDYRDPVYGIPVYSLYGEVRRPAPRMMEGWDVLLVDLQDVGCRIYTFLTTLIYIMDEIDRHPDKEIWILDRPNPAGRAIEGQILNMDFETFVGAAPVPMRHGLTLAEAALWYKEHRGLKVQLTVVPMQEYEPSKGPGFGWPEALSWVNPSPNMPRLSCARQYAGSVLIEGTNLSEGRGTTVPLEIVGAPDLPMRRILETMTAMAPQWLKGCRLREMFFEPTFHKFKGHLCAGMQVHCDDVWYRPSEFQPYRVYNLFLKAVHQLVPDFDLWRKPPYEYEEKLMPIDILSGGPELREWVESSDAAVDRWDEFLCADETRWARERKPFLLYGE